MNQLTPIYIRIVFKLFRSVKPQLHSLRANLYSPLGTSIEVGCQWL